MADNDEFVAQSARIAIGEAEENLIQAQRQYEDAARYGDANSGSTALAEYVAAKQRLDMLTGATTNKQNNAGQLSEASRRFIEKRVQAGEQITEEKWAEYLKGHHAAIGAGFTPDSDAYFKCVEGHLSAVGLGSPPLSEREAARISGLSEAEYAREAQKFRALKARGYYNDQQ